MLAGLPKAPSAYNPISNPKRAKTRQLYVLRRMHDLKYITDEQFRDAQNAPLAVRQGLREAIADPRRIRRRDGAADGRRAYGEDAYTKGLTVYTTIRRADQEAAYAAVRRGVIDYDRRHGYRGPEAYVEPARRIRPSARPCSNRVFQDVETSDGLPRPWSSRRRPRAVKAVLADGEAVEVTGDGLKFARGRSATRPRRRRGIRRGAVIRVQRDDKGHWEIVQMPQVEVGLHFDSPERRRDPTRWSAASISIAASSTTSPRRSGSRDRAFKPFIYSAALEKGFTPATIVNDAPFFVPADKAGGQAWEPKNYDGKFDGPMRIRTALARSKNLVTVRVLQAIGRKYAQDYIGRASASTRSSIRRTSPWRSARARPRRCRWWRRTRCSRTAATACRPYLITRSSTRRATSLSESQPTIAGENAERAIDPRNAFIMTSLLKDVIAYGTGDARAGARPHRPRRQDRHHQRQRRRLVLRLQRRAGRRLPGSASTSRARWATTRPAARRRCRSGSPTWRRSSRERPTRFCRCRAASLP